VSWLNLFLQSNKPADRLGEARQSGNSAATAEFAVLSRCASIFLITAGSSILAMILTSLPHLSQVSMSILKTRFNRFTQVIDARFSAGLWSASSKDPLTHRLMGQNIVYQKCSAVCHSACAATWAEGTPLAAKRDQFFIAARITPDSQEPVFKSPALQILIKLFGNVCR
jgi:hypothetical protein